MVLTGFVTVATTFSLSTLMDVSALTVEFNVFLTKQKETSTKIVEVPEILVEDLVEVLLNCPCCNNLLSLKIEPKRRALKRLASDN